MKSEYYWYAYSALMFSSATVVAAVMLVKLRRSDRYAKLEDGMLVLGGYLVAVAACGIGVYIGWESSYPTVVVNGYHRSTAPSGSAEAALGALYIPMLLSAGCFTAYWWLKRRRVRLAKSDEDRIWAALYAEYGWKEARRLYENYRRRIDQESD